MAETRVCPRCGSTDLGHDTPSLLSRLALDDSRVCNDCGYSGIFPVVEKRELGEYRAAVRDSDAPVATDGPAAPFSMTRFLTGAVFLLLGLPLIATRPWGGGLLVGLLSVVVGGAVIAEQLGRR